jgi:hypothetical protein
MNTPKGTIYIRDNAWYKTENVVKLGIASFAKDRSNTYITGEVERGEYICVIEIPLVKMKILDKMLKQYFVSYHIYKGGGTEFYNRCIVGLIEPYLQKLNVEYRILTTDEIHSMERCDRIRNLPNRDNLKQILNQINAQQIIQKYKNKLKEIKPKEHQKAVLQMIDNFYDKYDKGKIIWACGLGKALLSILIVKQMKHTKIVFGVPSNQLQKQIKNEIVKIFPNKDNILFVGGDEYKDVISTTDRTRIISFMNTTTDHPIFVISTYHSCHLLADLVFDFKIGDEAHHLVGTEKEEDTGFRYFHKISSRKSLFMTATEKTIQSKTNIYSMDDETVFGKYIDTKSVYWAIENKKITDYNILVLKNTETEVDEIIGNLQIDVCNKEIFISCYMALLSFDKYNDLTHLLLYTNTTEEAELAKKYIDEILSLGVLSICGLYNSAIHSKNCHDLEGEVCNFKNARYGIISCVYIFGEGWELLTYYLQIILF